MPLAVPGDYPTRSDAPFPRIAYAAAHVVADPARTRADGMPGIDWEATMAFRRHLWGLGFAIAERWIPRSAAWVWHGRMRRS